MNCPQTQSWFVLMTGMSNGMDDLNLQRSKWEVIETSPISEARFREQTLPSNNSLEFMVTGHDMMIITLRFNINSLTPIHTSYSMRPAMIEVIPSERVHSPSMTLHNTPMHPKCSVTYCCPLLRGQRQFLNLKSSLTKSLLLTGLLLHPLTKNSCTT